MADYFERMGREVSWQKLGEGFDHSEFGFQVLDEGVCENWREKLENLLAVG
jgi:hypothetical protein